MVVVNEEGEIGHCLPAFVYGRMQDMRQIIHVVNGKLPATSDELVLNVQDVVVLTLAAH